MNLSLGTAQLAPDYGVKDRAIQLTASDLTKIITGEVGPPPHSVDTAQSYENAHSILRACPQTGFEIRTKISLGADCVLDSSLITLLRTRVREVIDTLYPHKIKTIYIHDIDRHLPRFELIIETLMSVCQDYSIPEVGISSYNIATLERLRKDKHRGLRIQFPLNIFDRRLLNWVHISGAATDYNFSIRSVFLQGLLLERLKPRGSLKKYSGLLSDYFEVVDSLGVTPLNFCLDYVRSIEWIDEIIIGVKSVMEYAEVQSNLGRSTKGVHYGNLVGASTDNGLINPTNWSCFE